MSMVRARGCSRNVVVDLGATAVSYTTGKVIGVPTKIAYAFTEPGGTGILESLCLIDKEMVDLAVDLYFFQQKPTTQGANNGTFAVSAAEMLYCLGRVSVAAADYTKSSAAGEATKAGIGMSLAAATGTQLGLVGQGSKDLWVLAVARAAITFASASSLQLRVGILQD